MCTDWSDVVLSIISAADRRQHNVEEASGVRGHRLIVPSTDILLGKVVIRLLPLLTQTTGLTCSHSLLHTTYHRV